MYKSFALSIQGGTHIRDKKPCQDYATASSVLGCHIAAAADGHGGRQYFRSDIGARLACMAAVQCASKCILSKKFTDTMCNPNLPDTVKEQMIIQLERSIISCWGESIRKHLTMKSFTKEELSVIDEDKRECMADFDCAVKAYGSTLLLAVLGKNFWFGLHIGDGRFVTVSDSGECKQPIELDKLCVGNYTTSICNGNAINYFHHAWGCEPLRAILVATDGVNESFESEEAFYNFYRGIVEGTESDFDRSIDDLNEDLPYINQKGSLDDMSIAGIIHIKDSFSRGKEDDTEQKKSKVQISITEAQTMQVINLVNAHASALITNTQEQNEQIVCKAGDETTTCVPFRKKTIERLFLIKDSLNSFGETALSLLHSLAYDLIQRVYSFLVAMRFL